MTSTEAPGAFHAELHAQELAIYEARHGRQENQQAEAETENGTDR